MLPPEETSIVSAPLLCTEEHFSSLIADGYVVLPGAVERPLVDCALRAVNRSLGRANSGPSLRDQMCTDIINTPAITDLYNHSYVKVAIDTLLQENTSVSEAQVAIRFPGDNATTDFVPHDGWEKHWHIDGLGDQHSGRDGDEFFGDIRNFTVLVGVLLQDATEELMGNLVVYPGAHAELQSYFEEHGFSDVYRQGVQGLPQLPMRRGHRQIRARAGDAVLLNYSMPHTVAPNCGSLLRYAAYFRITSRLHHSEQTDCDSSKHHRPASMLQVWRDWPGLVDFVSFAPSDSAVGSQAVAEDNSSPRAAN